MGSDKLSDRITPITASTQVKKDASTSRSWSMISRHPNSPPLQVQETQDKLKKRNTRSSVGHIIIAHASCLRFRE
jgi:hypothetical protein